MFVSLFEGVEDFLQFVRFMREDPDGGFDGVESDDDEFSGYNDDDEDGSEAKVIDDETFGVVGVAIESERYRK